jgi:GGDEF domain-containing protein
MGLRIIAYPAFRDAAWPPRLRSCMRAGDIVARVGGDEFAIRQMALKGPLEAHALAERAHLKRILRVGRLRLRGP